MNCRIFAALLFVILVIPIVHAHGGEVHETTESETNSLWDKEWTVILWASSIITVLVTISAAFRKYMKEGQKKLMFSLMVIVIGGSTLYLAADTIYTNVSSETGGPVHWHADYEIWNCGTEIELHDPEGFSNKVGTTIFHEHNDNRIHIEGAVKDLGKVGIDDFFEVIGGQLTETGFSVMDEHLGHISVENGEMCNGEEGEVQVFLYRIENPRDTKNWVYEQTKLDDFDSYIPTPYGQVPPGDCVIIEFDKPKDKTDKMCIFYEAAIQRGELSGN